MYVSSTWGWVENNTCNKYYTIYRWAENIDVSYCMHTNREMYACSCSPSDHTHSYIHTHATYIWAQFSHSCKCVKLNQIMTDLYIVATYSSQAIQKWLSIFQWAVSRCKHKPFLPLLNKSLCILKAAHNWHDNVISCEYVVSLCSIMTMTIPVIFYRRHLLFRCFNGKLY